MISLARLWDRIIFLLPFKKRLWLHSDYKVRLSEVHRISNQKILEYIALNDSYSYKKNLDIPSVCYLVREAAIAKLQEKELLEKIKKSPNSFLRKAAADRLDYLEFGSVKIQDQYEDYEDNRVNMDPHQSPFDFK